MSTQARSASAGPFRLEHIVHVDDPAEAPERFLAREQLWTGLRQTIVASYAFDPTVDVCVVDGVARDVDAA